MVFNGNVGQCNTFRGKLPANSGNLRELTSLYEKVTALWQRFVFQLTCFCGSLIVSVVLMTRIDTGSSKEFTFAPTSTYKQQRLPFLFEKYCVTKDLLNNRKHFPKALQCSSIAFPFISSDYIFFFFSTYLITCKSLRILVQHQSYIKDARRRINFFFLNFHIIVLNRFCISSINKRYST